MTVHQYNAFLNRANISQADIVGLFEMVLRQEEDILEYLGHVQTFCLEHDMRSSNSKELVHQFMRGLVSKLIAWRTRNHYSGAETVFNKYFPKPSADSIQESWRHRSDQERERRYRSEQRRGFYRNGEPTVDCGEDLSTWLRLYEHKTERETART